MLLPLLLYLASGVQGEQVFWQAKPRGYLPLPDTVLTNWGTHSPYHTSAVYTVPDGCEVNMVNLLERHGARYPNADQGDRIKPTLTKFAQAISFPNPGLAFLANYTYGLGDGNLVPYGAAEAFNSGVEAYPRYAHLLGPSIAGTPFFRAVDLGRMIDSYTNFSAGLIAPASRSHTVNFTITPPVRIADSPDANNTLASHCPASTLELKDEKRDIWRKVFVPPIRDRLSKGVVFPQGSGIELTIRDVLNLMEMCIFETLSLAKVNIPYAPSPQEATQQTDPSPFCPIFLEADWPGFSYAYDVEKYYEIGYGNPFGPVQGVGYAAEVLSRLTNKPLFKSPDSPPITSQNTSLPFPLNRTFYADFTHGTAIVGILSGLGLYKQDKDLPPDRMGEHPGWTSSKFDPFMARLVIERLTCSNTHRGDLNVEDDYMRILVNDDVQPLPCQNASPEDPRFGLCTVKSFVESQFYARTGGNGDWDKCFQTS